MFFSSFRSFGLPELNRSNSRRYLVALVTAGAAAVTSILLQRFAAMGAPWLVAFLPVIVCAWYGGIGPALMAAAAGAAAGIAWFVPRPRLAHLSSDAAMPLAAYVLASVAIALVSEAYRRRLADAHDEIASLQQGQEELQFSVSLLRSQCADFQQRLEQEIRRNRKLEDQVKTSEQRIGIAEAAARLRVFDWDLRTNCIELAGDAAIFGLLPGAWKGHESWMSCIHPDDRAITDREIARALERREPLNVEFRVVWPDGSEHWLAAKGEVVCGAAQTPSRLAGIFVDITEQKATEAALIRNEKLAAAGRLAATVAHEINNPLTALTNLLFIVRGDKTLSRAGAQYLHLAQEELGRVSRLSQQALGFYKEQATPSRFSIPELLDEVLALYSRNMPANIAVEKAYGESIEVRAIRGEIWQVFANVISNAAYALREGGTLTIGASAAYSADGPGMQVRISDTGSGISPENLAKIFQPFFTTRPHTGNGLGLWIARDLIHKHGGSIDVESHVEEENHGTSMTVFLPATTAHAAEVGAGEESIHTRASAMRAEFPDPLVNDLRRFG